MRPIADMTYIIGLKLRIYPTNEQKDMIAVNDGAARFIYNRLVARNREIYKLRKVGCYIKPIADRLDYLLSLGQNSSALKAAYPFLEDNRIDSLAIVNAVNHYQSAWNQFRKVPGTSTPTFHKKGYAQSYQTNGMYPKTACAINDGNIHLTDKRHIKLPKLGSVRFKGSDRIYKIFARTCETRIGTITISKDECGHYYASLQIASIYPFHKQIRHSGKALGIDVNIENFCMDSNGDTVPNPKFRKATQEKLCKEQRQLSRMATRAKKEHRSFRDSRNYQKQRIKVAKLHKHAAAQNEAFQHLLSKAIIESQDIVCVEKLTLSDCEWNCPKCGRHHIRDWNSAINIRNRGLAILQTP